MPPKNLVRGLKPASERESKQQFGPATVAIQDVAMGWITLLLGLIDALIADRSRLALENVALRQQVTVALLHGSLRGRIVAISA